jgi:arylsulfatase A-like enzyme
VRTDSLASNIDFTPTILELAGVPKDDWHEVDGASLVPILKDPTATVRDSVFLDMGLARAVVRDDFKYLAIRESSYIRDSTREMRISMIEENQKSKGPNSACLGPDADWGHQGLVPGGGLRPEIQCRQKHAHYADRDQLYDLRKDPEEQTNLFDNPEYEAVVEKLRLELEEHLAALPDSYAEFK